eukprot:4313953-Amphidinium_carterae.1
MSCNTTSCTQQDQARRFALVEELDLPLCIIGQILHLDLGEAILHEITCLWWLNQIFDIYLHRIMTYSLLFAATGMMASKTVTQPQIPALVFCS